VNDFNFEPVAPAVEIHGYGNPAGNDWVPILPSSGPISQPHSESYVTGPSTVDRLNPDSPEIDPEHVANLLKAALAAIDRSWFILPMKPYTKEPMACTTNALGRRRRWQNGVNSFYSASNTDNPQEHCLNEETGDQSPTIATQCWRDGMDANIGLAVGRSDLTVLDYDTGFDNQADLHAFEKLFSLPSSWVARSGRVTGYACHVYMKGRMASGSFKIGNVKCDVKSDGGIVAAVGSYHKSGNQYAWESDITQPMAVTPVETLAKLMQEHGGTTKYVLPTTSPFISIDSDDEEDEENGFNPTCEDFRQYFIDQGDEEELVHVGYEQDSEGQWRNDFIRPEGCPRKEGHGDAPPSAYHVYLYDNGKKGAWCFHE
jgi:hypothetical protein